MTTWKKNLPSRTLHTPTFLEVMIQEGKLAGGKGGIKVPELLGPKVIHG